MEELAQRQFALELVANTRYGTRCQQRVATQSEEVVVDAHLFNAQHLAPLASPGCPADSWPPPVFNGSAPQ